MPKKGVTEVVLYLGPGDFEANEVQVCIYLPLTIPRSRARIRVGGPQGDQVTKPLGYPISSNDVLEYMPTNRDLEILLKKLKQADELRDLRNKLKKEGKTTDEIREALELKKKELDSI